MDVKRGENDRSSAMYLHIAGQVVELIRQRRLKPHEPVPSEAELARLYGVSRMTTKLALDVLAKQGIVYRLPRRGTFLAAGVRSADEEQTRRPAASPQPSAPPGDAGDKRRRLLVAIVVPAMDDYTSRIVAAVEQEARANDAELIVKLCRTGAEQDAGLRHLAREAKADGIILFPLGNGACSDEVLRLKLMKFPIVIIDRLVRDIEIDCVYHDHFQGMCNMIRFLIDCGHRSIGYVSAPLMGITSREERYQGYIQTLLDNRIPVNVRSIFLKCPPFSRTDLPGDLRAYLAENPNVTAVACSDDYVAAALMYTAIELGIAVPDRLSIAGFSDIQMAALLPVPLTTVRQSTDQLGRSAVKLLMRRIRQSRESVLTVRLNTAIVRRQSVKRLSSGELPAEERPIGKPSVDERLADKPSIDGRSADGRTAPAALETR